MARVNINFHTPDTLSPGRHQVALRFPSGDIIVLDVTISPEGRVTVVKQQVG